VFNSGFEVELPWFSTGLLAGCHKIIIIKKWKKSKTNNADIKTDLKNG